MLRWLTIVLLVAGMVGMGLKVAAAAPDREMGVKVKLEDCPKPVQDTIQAQAKGGTIGKIEKETEDGKTVYEAEITVDGKKYELEIAEDGTLIKKELDD